MSEVTVPELYEWPPTRSNRARWALEELNLDYQRRPIELGSPEQDTTEYRAIHPLGAVPALRTRDYVMFESAAIVMQLIDEHPDSGLAPPHGDPERAAWYQWCLFASAELDPPLMMFFDNTMRPADAMRPPGTQYSVALADRGAQDYAIRAEVLSQALDGREYLLDSGFSGADIVVGHSCFMANFMGLLNAHPILLAYYNRLSERPAHQRTYS